MVTVLEAQNQLGRLVAEASRGDIIVLTDGAVQATLAPCVPSPQLDPEEDTPQLENELLKAVRGPHAPFSKSELRQIADRTIQEEGARRPR